MDGNNILTKFFSSLADVVRIKLDSDSVYTPTELSEAIEQIDSTTSGSIHPDLTCYIPGGITEIETVIIGENATKISNSAYRDCSNLKNVIILGNLDSIGANAFDGCLSLENINIPDTVTQIGGYAFRSCKVLENINIPNSIKKIGAVAFEGSLWYSNQKNDSLVYFGPILYKLKGAAPNNGYIEGTKDIVSIAPDCFRSSGIVSFKGNVLENIGQSAFQACTKLEEAYFYQPESKKIRLENNVFSGCSNLKTLYFDNLDALYTNAINGCTNLTDVYILNKDALPNSIDLSAHKSRITLYVHPNLIDKWKSKFVGYNIVEYKENE